MQVNEGTVSPRIRELRSPGLRASHAFDIVLRGFTMGSVGTFLLVVVLGIALLELEISPSTSLDFDALLRASMGPVLISGGVMLVAWPIALLVRPVAWTNAAGVFSREHPNDAPPREDRAPSVTPPAIVLQQVGAVVVLVAGFVFVIGIVMMFAMRGESSGEFGAAVMITVIAAVPTVVGVGMLVAGRILVPTQKWVEDLRMQWDQRAEHADQAEWMARVRLPAAEPPRMLRRSEWRGVLPTILYIVLVLGTVVLSLGVLLRKPCRGCSLNEWGVVGEGLIDVFSGTGGLLLIAGGVLCAALWLVLVVRGFVREEVLRRWLRESGNVLIDDERQRAELVRLPGAGTRLTAAMAGIGAAVLIIAGGIAMTDWEGVDASIALGVGIGVLVLAVPVGLVSYGREQALRILARDRMLPGDLREASELDDEDDW